MLTISTRNYSQEEKLILGRQLPSRFQVFEWFITAVCVLGIFTVFAYASFAPKRGFPGIPAPTPRKEIPETTKMILMIITGMAIVAISILWAVWMKKRKIKDLQHKMDNDLVEVFYVQTTRVAEQEEYEDLGPSYYIEVDYFGQTKTLYLWGQYLFDVDPEKFPSTSFEYVRKEHDKSPVLIKPLGKKLDPEMILPSVRGEQWQTGEYWNDGNVIDQSLDEIIQQIKAI